MNNRTVVSLAFATLLSTTALLPSQASAAQCGTRVSVTGIPATGMVYKLKKNRAERRAERAWRGFVAGENGPSIFAEFQNTNHPSYGLGTAYANLDKAKNVKVNCKGGGKMYCTVTATPCR